MLPLVGSTICSFFLFPSVLGWIHFSFSYTISTSKYLFKLALGSLTLLSSLLQVRRYHFPTNPTSQMPTPLLGGGEGVQLPCLRLLLPAWHSGLCPALAEQTLGEPCSSTTSALGELQQLSSSCSG